MVILKFLRKNKSFTLIELIAIMVILAVVLAITFPTISNIIIPSREAAFRSDARLILKAIDLVRINDENVDLNNISVENIWDLLKVSNQNYQALDVEAAELDQTFEGMAIRIEGKGKWEGLYACGTYRNMKVTNDEAKCIDIIPPHLTLLGLNPHDIYLGDSYIDAGAVAFDNVDGDITGNIIKVGFVNVNVPGTYTITYMVSDSNENFTSASRTVRVIDNVPPIVYFSMNGNEQYAKGRSTIVSIVDDSNLSPNGLKYVWTTSPEQPDLSDFLNSYNNGQSIDTPPGVTGGYYLWVLVTDDSGNQKYASTKVFRLDNTPPIIVMNGANKIINKGSIYMDEGATATDNIDGLITVISSGTVNPNVIGEYEIVYNAIDSSGNEAIAVVRSVVVRDAEAPEIVILGNNPHYMTIGGIYNDAGATATDDDDGDITSNIQITGTVNTNLAGTYTVTYTVIDSSGNSALRTRQVIVEGIVQYRFRTSSTSTSCSTCYDTCYRYATGTAQYSCSSGYLSGTSCVSSYNVYSTFHATYTCSSGTWAWQSHYCSGNCNAPCSNGSSPNGYQTGSTCPSGSCTSGTTSCSNYWMGTCFTTSPATLTYICPSGYTGGGSTSTCVQSYSCNPYSCYCSTTTTWSSWSSWSTTPVSETSTRQVEIRYCTSIPC